MPKFKLELGAEPKKVAVLVGLLAIAAYFFLSGDLGSGGETAQPTNVASAPSQLSPRALQRPDPDAIAPPPPRASNARTQQRQDFRPSLKAKRGEERDHARIDPTLRLDLLEKVAAVPMMSGGRSLFDFGPDTVAAAKPKLPEPNIEVKPQRKMLGPEPPPPPPAPPVKPPPPPINLKFYGSSLPLRGGAKRVFCIQGEDILIPAEGDVIQRRYKIVRINQASVLVEDLDHKHSQTIPIDEVPKG